MIRIESPCPTSMKCTKSLEDVLVVEELFATWLEALFLDKEFFLDCVVLLFLAGEFFCV